MSLSQLLKAQYTNQNRGQNLRQIALPQAVGAINCDGIAIQDGGALTYGDWVDVALQALITTDTLVVGVVLDTPSATGIGEIWTVDIGSTLCTVGATTTNYATAAAVNAVPAAIIAAHRAELRFELVTDAGILQPVMLEYPVLIPNGVGILARGYTVSGSNGGADTVQVSVLLVQGFEGRMS